MQISKLYIITKTYEVPMLHESAKVRQLTDIIGIFKDKHVANEFWQKNCKDKPGYRFDEAHTDLV